MKYLLISKIQVSRVLSLVMLGCCLAACYSEQLNQDVSMEIPEALREYIAGISAESMDGARVEITVEKLEDKIFKLETTLTLEEDTDTRGWAINIFPAFTGNFHWTPHLTPGDDYIIADHVFRAPALISSANDKILTLIPDLGLRAKSEYRWYMDLDVPENKMVIGISNYVVKEHVLFNKADNTTLKAGKIELSFYLMVDEAKEALRNPWRKAHAFMWEKYGKRLSEQGEPLQGSIEPYVAHTYNWAFNTWKDAVWQEFILDGKVVGAPVFIVNYTQSPNYPGEIDEREFRSIWNQAWFNSLRSAQGLYRYGARTNNEAYIHRSQKSWPCPSRKGRGFSPG